MTDKYEEEAEKFMKALSIAIEAIQKFTPPDWNEIQTRVAVGFYKGMYERLENRSQQRMSMSDLKDEIKAAFTYFNEGDEEPVEYFWQRLKEESLDYKRVNKFDKILKRKKIRNRDEYDFVTDVVVALRQRGEITVEQFIELTDMLGNYERRRK